MDCKKDSCIVLYNECGSRSVVLHVLLLQLIEQLQLVIKSFFSNQLLLPSFAAFYCILYMRVLLVLNIYICNIQLVSSLAWGTFFLIMLNVSGYTTWGNCSQWTFFFFFCLNLFLLCKLFSLTFFRNMSLLKTFL